MAYYSKRLKFRSKFFKNSKENKVNSNKNSYIVYYLFAYSSSLISTIQKILFRKCHAFLRGAWFFFFTVLVVIVNLSFRWKYHRLVNDFQCSKFNCLFIQHQTWKKKIIIKTKLKIKLPTKNCSHLWIIKLWNGITWNRLRQPGWKSLHRGPLVVTQLFVSQSDQ